MEPDALSGELDVLLDDITEVRPTSCSCLDPGSSSVFTSHLMRFSGESVIDIGVFRWLASMEHGMTEELPFRERSTLFDLGNRPETMFPSSSSSSSSFVALSEERWTLKSGLEITTPLTSCLKNAYILPGNALMCFCGNSSVVEGMI